MQRQLEEGALLVHWWWERLFCLDTVESQWDELDDWFEDLSGSLLLRRINFLGSPAKNVDHLPGYPSRDLRFQG